MSRALESLMTGLAGSASLPTKTIEFSNKRLLLNITYYQYQDLYYGGTTFQQIGSQVGWSSVGMSSPDHRYQKGYPNLSDMINACLDPCLKDCQEAFRDYPFTLKYKKYFDKLVEFYQNYETP